MTDILDIPPPIKDKNKAGYMLESDELTQDAEKSLFQIFAIGFSIPCLIWISIFASLGEPCSVFCSGKELWDVYVVIFANFFACGGILLIALFDSIGNKKFRSVIFFIGFASGSFIGMSLGELFV